MTASNEDLQRQIEKQAERMQHILDLARAVNSSRSLLDLLRACFRRLSDALPYDEVFLMLHEGSAYRAFIAARTGGLEPQELVFPEAPLTQRVIDLGKPLLLDDLTAPETVERYRALVYAPNPDDPDPMRAFMAVPVTAPMQGVLSVQSRLPNVYTDADLEHLATLAELVGVAVKRARWDDREAILQRVARLGRHTARSEDFFPELLETVVSSWQAGGGGVWEIGDAGWALRASAGWLDDSKELSAPLEAMLPANEAPAFFHGEEIPAALASELPDETSVLVIPIRCAEFRAAVVLASKRRFTDWDIELALFMTRELEAHVETLVLYRKLEEEAIKDPLTGAFNRRYFMLKTQETLSHAERYGHRLGLLIVDLQNFGQVNNTWGHQTGDRVLELVAKAFSGQLRASDLFFRVGGDEFVLLLPQADAASCRAAATRLSSSLGEHPELVRYRVAANIGYAIYPDDGYEIDPLLEVGDKRMYEAKAAGKAVYSPTG